MTLVLPFFHHMIPTYHWPALTPQPLTDMTFGRTKQMDRCDKRQVSFCHVVNRAGIEKLFPRDQLSVFLSQMLEVLPSEGLLYQITPINQPTGKPT
jgi:hypothetical protein